jgi:hypothetical protein
MNERKEKKMTQKKGLLVVRLDPPANKEADWNKWYNEIHIGARMAIPGFINTRRYEITSGMDPKFELPSPKYLTLYELDNPNVLKSKEYQKLRAKEATFPKNSFEAISKKLPGFSIGIYEQIFPLETEYQIPKEAEYLLGVAHSKISPKVEEEYNAWYNLEHIPSYLQIPGFLTARRFHITNGSKKMFPKSPSPDYAAFYDLTNNTVFGTEEYKVRSATPWSGRVRGWTFKLRKMTNLFRLFYIAKA